MRFAVPSALPFDRLLRWWLSAACLLLTCWAAPAGAQPLRLAVADLPYHSPALVAGWQNFFAAEGLRVEIVRCVSGRRCLQHLADKEADFATVADTPIMLAAHDQQPFEILATMTSSRDNIMAARTDRGIRSPADLRGKRIGFVPGSIAHYFADTFLSFHGIGNHEVTWVELDPVKAPQQLLAGEVDAAGLYPPHGPVALRLLGDKGLALANPRLYTSTINIVARPGITEADATKLLRAVKRAIDYISEDGPRARTLVASQLKIDATQLAESWGSMSFRLLLGQSLLTTLEAEARWARRVGLVSGANEPDFLARMRTGPLRKVDPGAVSLVE